MKPLSNDLRQRILDAVDRREGSRRQLAVRFSVDVSTITRLLQLRRETGAFDPRPHAGGIEHVRIAQRRHLRPGAQDAGGRRGHTRDADSVTIG